MTDFTLGMYNFTYGTARGKHLQWGPRFCISNKLEGDGGSVGLQSTLVVVTTRAVPLKLDGRLAASVSFVENAKFLTLTPDQMNQNFYVWP